MSSYYCLMAGLPDIDLSDTQPTLTLADLREQADEVLTDGDRRLAFYFYLRYDCRNIARLVQDPEAELDPMGNYTREDYDDLITSARELNFNVHRYPPFLSEFVREYPTNKDAAGYFPDDDILVRYLTYAIHTAKNAFMRRWYQLELDINNILTALIARGQGWDVAAYVKGEGEMQEMIKQNKSKDFDLTRQWDYVKDIFSIASESDPVKKEKMADAFRWQWLDEQTFFEPFSFEALFAYLSKLEMQQRWAALDPQKGQEAFRQIIDNLRSEAQVPEEFIRK